jgi:HEAT repeat protein
MPAQGAQQKRLDEWLVRQLSEPELKVERVAGRVIKEPELISALVDCLEARPARVKYGAAKTLRLLANKAPDLVYPWFDFFVQQLDSENNVFRWNAMRVLAALAPADADNRIERVLDKYLSVIPGPRMITAGNAIAGAAEIAVAKPHLANQVARAILGVRDAVYKTDECRNVAIGHAIVALGRFYEIISDKQAVIAFVRAQQENPRSGTRRKAQEFLRKCR